MKDIHDVIMHAKFVDDRLRGSGVAAGQISAFPIDFVGRPYNTLTLPCERVINNARQLSRSLVGIYHWRKIKYERFGGRPSVGGRPGARAPGPPKSGPVLYRIRWQSAPVFTARCYASAVLAIALWPSVRLSVRPSQIGVLLKRLNVGSHKQHRTIAQGV